MQVIPLVLLRIEKPRGIPPLPPLHDKYYTRGKTDFLFELMRSFAAILQQLP